MIDQITKESTKAEKAAFGRRLLGASNGWDRFTLQSPRRFVLPAVVLWALAFYGLLRIAIDVVPFLVPR